MRIRDPFSFAQNLHYLGVKMTLKSERMEKTLAEVKAEKVRFEDYVAALQNEANSFCFVCLLK